MKRISIAAAGIVVLSSNKKEDQFTFRICTGSDIKIQVRWRPWIVVTSRLVEAPGYTSDPEIFYEPSTTTDIPRFTTSSRTLFPLPARSQRPGYFPAKWSAARLEAFTRIIPGNFIQQHQF